MDRTPIWRPTARLLVLDPLDRLLLFSSLGTDGRTWWFTPGGGVRRGETLTAAAVRELAEETGYACAESDLGPVVATCAGLWDEPAEGRRYFGADSFFLVRVAHAVIRTDGQEDLERSVITGHRWWTAEELRQADGVVLPVGLADLAGMLVRDGAPAAPARLPWRRTG